MTEPCVVNDHAVRGVFLTQQEADHVADSQYDEDMARFKERLRTRPAAAVTSACIPSTDGRNLMREPDMSLCVPHRAMVRKLVVNGPGVL